MSRLGKQPIQIPAGVEVTFADGVLTVKGAKGTLTRTFNTKVVDVSVADNQITLTPNKKQDGAQALWGTYASHIGNMIEGVTNGFEKKLEVEGVGYRAEAQGNKLVLSVGYSHPVEKHAPEGINIAVEKNLITISGPDKEVVGQFAANVRAVRKPEPYKGKGIHYVGEYIIRKQGKKAVA
jgi:large subunit ribosomal protein L6